MRRVITLVILLAVMGFAAQTAWSQTVTTMKVYVADPAYVQFYREHEGYVHSRTGHDGQQTDYFPLGKFDSVCHVVGPNIRAFRCGNIVDTIECVVNITITIPPCPAPTPGATGATGPQGLQGDTGPQGFQGLRGQQGPRGSAGPQGGPGTNGVNGVNGLNGTCVIYSPVVLLQGKVFTSCDTVKHETWVNPGKLGLRDYIFQGIGGLISNLGIKPAYSNIQVSNGSSSVSNGGSSNASATQRQGQGQEQGQLQGQNQGQGQTSNNTNNNNNSNENTNANANDNNSNANASNSNNIGIVNDNAAAANAGGN